MANEYITVAALKKSLGLEGETFADDDLALAAESSSRAIDEVCGRRFWLDADANSVRHYSPWDRNLLRIDDLATLTWLKSDAGGDGVFEDEWIENTDFVLEPANASADGKPATLIRVHPRGAFVFPIRYPRSVEVKGRFGWPAVPPAIKAATSILAGRLLKRNREAPFAVVNLGLETAGRIARVDPDVSNLVSPFVRVPLLV